MISDRELSDTIGHISEASVFQLAEIAEVAIHQLGWHGRDGAEALLDRVKEKRDANFEEGLAQIASVEGVLSGRTDAL